MINIQPNNRYEQKSKIKKIIQYSPRYKIPINNNNINQNQSNNKRFQRNNSKKYQYKNQKFNQTQRQDTIQQIQYPTKKSQVIQKQTTNNSKSSIFLFDSMKNNNLSIQPNSKYLTQISHNCQNKSQNVTNIPPSQPIIQSDTSIFSNISQRNSLQRNDQRIKSSSSINQQKIQNTRYNKANFKYYQGPYQSKQKYFNKFYSYFNNNYHQHSQLGNFSTEQSIIQTSVIKKKTSSSQTDNKKYVNFGINSQTIKKYSIKIQTQQTNKSYQKYIDQLKNKIHQLQKQNKQIKQQINFIQKQNILKIKNLQNNLSKKNYYSNSENHTARNQNQGSIKQSFKEASLHVLVDNLKKQLDSLKTGMGVKRLQQIIQTIKKQNIMISNQLQSISLKYRILQQQKNTVTNTQQQNRKLKLQIKYIRSNIKQVKEQNQKYKNQNNKLKKQITLYLANNFNHQQQDKMRQTFSETDSLNLSCSMIRE